MRKTFHKIKTKLSHKIYLHKTKKGGIPKPDRKEENNDDRDQSKRKYLKKLHDK